MPYILQASFWFVFAGWIPISAGWLVSKLHDTPELEVA